MFVNSRHLLRCGTVLKREIHETDNYVKLCAYNITLLLRKYSCGASLPQG